MLLKVDCEPKLMACVTLTFDDGTSKDVDIQKGMYATIQYMNRAVLSSVTGIVTNVYLAPKAMKVIEPDDIPNHLGYICDPNYVNSGFLDARNPYHKSCPPRKPPKPLHGPGRYDNDFRNYIEVLDKATGKSVRIDVYSITDVFTIYEESKEVRTPDDCTRIMFIRDNSGALEYSSDGNEWNAVTAEIDTDRIDAIEKVANGNSTLIANALGTIDGYNTTMDEYNAKIADQDSKMDAYSAKIEEQNAIIANQTNTINNFTTVIQGLQAAIADIQTRVKSLEDAATPSE